MGAAASLRRKWRDDPLAYFSDVWGLDLLGPPWDAPGQRAYQAEIVTAIAEHDETYVVTGNAVGKDFILGRVVPWWLHTRKPSIVITTSYKDSQLRTILWGEIRDAVAKARIDFGGKLMPSQPFWSYAEKWYAKGVVGSEETAFHGSHSDYVMVIGDESAGIAEFVWPAMLGCAVGSEDKIVMIGNPTCAPTHPFAKGCRERDRPGEKKTIRIPSTETPNYRQNREVIRGLMTRQGVDRIYRRFGKGSAIANARVEAKFPDAGASSLIGYQHIGPARERWAKGVRASEKDRDQARVGCDVARFGDDVCSTYVRAGCEAFEPDGWPKPNPDQVEVTDSLAAVARETRAVSVAIDGGAMGPGPIDYLRNDEHRERLAVPPETAILEVLFGGKAADEEQFADKRTELWVNLRDWLRDDASMEIDDDLEEELLAPEVGWVGRRMKLEPKDKTKERLGRSPDRADALALAVGGHVGQPDSLALASAHVLRAAEELSEDEREDREREEARKHDWEAAMEDGGRIPDW